MTDNTQELDEILIRFGVSIAEYANFGSPFNSDDENIAGAEALYQTSLQEAKQAILDWHNKQVEEAIYGFHGFVMEADIIRPEVDQAFNYGRLHRAIDDYIAERNKLKESK